MSNTSKIIIGGIMIIVLAGVFYVVKGNLAAVTPITTPTPVTSSTPTSPQGEPQRYINEFVQERKTLADNFKPSPTRKTYAGNDIYFTYPDNFIATSTASGIVLVTPPKIYEIASHLETEFYLPALTIEFHKNTTSQELLNKDYAEYKSAAQHISRNGRPVTQIKVINGFDGSEFIVELFDTPSGVTTITYPNEKFSENFSSILNSTQTK